MANAIISISASGVNTIITAPANTGIVIRQIVLQANALATVTFKAGTTVLSGPMTFPSGGSLVVGGAADTIWDLGHADFVLSLTIGLAISIGGWLVYDTYPM